MKTNLHEFSKILSRLQIQHILSSENNKIYFTDSKYSVMLTLDDDELFLRVFQKKEDEAKQNLELCRAVKFKLLKKLHEINKVEADGEFRLEVLPEDPQKLKLWKGERLFQPKTLFEF